MLGAIFLAASTPALLAPPPQEPAPVPAVDPAAVAPAVGVGPRYAFEVRDVQVEGLDWRGVLKGKARRLGWRSGVSTWAIPEQTALDLIDHVQKSPRANVMQAPLAVAEAGQPARTLTGSTVQLVVDLERRVDGPPGSPSGVAYQPILEQMHNGLDLTLSASPSPEGLVVGLNLDESTIQGVHTGSFEDAVSGPAPGDDRPILGLFRRRGEGGEDPDVTRAGAMTLQASFQVPEVVRSHVEGAWALQPGELLLVSLGARSSPEKWGRPAVVERLVLVSARPESAGMLDRGPGVGPGPAPITAPASGHGTTFGPVPSLSTTPAPPASTLPAAAPPPPLVPGTGPGGR